MKSEILFVGTNAAKYAADRAFASILLHNDGFYALLDCGENTTGALYKQHVSLNLINAVIISHFHPDHYAGLVPLVLQMKLSGRIKPLTIYVCKEEVAFTKNLFFASYFFQERIEFDIIIKGFQTETDIALTENFSFVAKQNSHLDEYKVYDTENKLSFNSNSFLITMGEQKIFYTSDIGSASDLNLFKNESANLIITEGYHIEVSDIIDIQNDQKPEHTIITHYDDNGKMAMENAISGADKTEKIILANDGLKLRLGEEIEFGYFTL